MRLITKKSKDKPGVYVTYSNAKPDTQSQIRCRSTQVLGCVVAPRPFPPSSFSPHSSALGSIRTGHITLHLSRLLLLDGPP